MSSSELSELEGSEHDLSDSDFERPTRVKKRRVVASDEEEEEIEEEEEVEEEVEEEESDGLDSEELEFVDYNDQGTPDPQRMTSRQKSMLTEGGASAGDFLELPLSSRQKILSQEEQALKRTELARRRKNLSERKLEEEKMDTLNKLLYKQPKKGSNSGTETPIEEEKDAKKRREMISHAAMTSWKSCKAGMTFSYGEESEHVAEEV